MSTIQVQSERLIPRPLPAEVDCAQPGRGLIMRLELAWGRLRRRWLRRFRPRYVARMHQLRHGDCPACPHDIIDPRDLKFFGNVCGFWFEPEHDRFRWRGRLRLARWGLAELILITGFLLLLAAATAWLLPYAAVLPLALALFVVSFFRDPERVIPQERGAVVAPADGVVDDIEELEFCEPLGGPAVKLGIFLSVFNVHVNRAPEASRVIELSYRRGCFGNAMRPDCTAGNEQLAMLLEQDAPPYRRFLVKQIVGAIARRIVCAARPGERLERGQRYGMIKFGSRTELYLPREDRLCLEVKRKQSVRGGSSVLARYQDPPAR